MNKLPSRISAARRNAEAALSKIEKRESDFRLEQQRELEAMALKTERLRALRLAKEAADQSAAAAKPAPRARPKARRSKQT
jgi:hypothetical protein